MPVARAASGRTNELWQPEILAWVRLALQGADAWQQSPAKLPWNGTLHCGSFRCEPPSGHADTTPPTANAERALAFRARQPSTFCLPSSAGPLQAKFGSRPAASGPTDEP